MRAHRASPIAAILALFALAAPPAAACSTYSCDGVGWQAYDPEKPGVMAEFARARRAGTAQALDRFIRDYPGSPAASEALDLRDRIADPEPSAGPESAARPAPAGD